MSHSEDDLRKLRECAQHCGWVLVGPGNPYRHPSGEVIGRVGWIDPEGEQRWVLPELEHLILPRFLDSLDAASLLEEVLERDARATRNRTRFNRYAYRLGMLCRGIPGRGIRATPRMRVDSFLAVMPYLTKP